MNENSYIEHQVAQGLTPDEYRVGDPEEDGHTHHLYLRDDVPIATSSSKKGTGLKGWHAHSITKDDGNLVCSASGPDMHIHTVFKLVKPGNKVPKDEY